MVYIKKKKKKKKKKLSQRADKAAPPLRSGDNNRNSPNGAIKSAGGLGLPIKMKKGTSVTLYTPLSSVFRTPYRFAVTLGAPFH
jgi:hypothetical protein